MRTVTVYEAEDGTRFESPSDCLTYESGVNYDIKLYDSQGNLMEDWFTDNFADDVRMIDMTAVTDVAAREKFRKWFNQQALNYYDDPASGHIHTVADYMFWNVYAEDWTVFTMQEFDLWRKAFSTFKIEKPRRVLG